MKWIATTVTLLTLHDAPSVDRVSELFYDMGLSGVVVEDPDMEPVEGWGDDALPKPSHHTVTGYLPADETQTDNARCLETALDDLKRLYGIETRISFTEVNDEDWAESWKAYFWPEKLTDTLVVKPTWREYAPAPGEIVLEIDPGMAFGTGTHATTSLCIQMIQDYLRPGDHFLDVGTGSGILMIAAAKLGASHVNGVDMDSVACDIARENLRLNHVAPACFQVACGDLLEAVSGKFKIVTANILSEVVLMLLNDVAAVLAPGAVLICSGIIEANTRLITDKMKSVGLSVLEVRDRDGWVAIAARSR